MKRLVASEALVTAVSALVASALMVLIRPGPDVAFLIAVGVAAVGLVVILGPDWRQLQGEKRQRRMRRGGDRR
jgi:hypothetical protein